MVELVSRRYSTAFFELAVEQNIVDTLYKEATILVETLSNEQDFVQVINHPEVTFEQKFDLLKNVFEGKINELFFGLFNIVLIKNREEDLLGILVSFVQKCEEYTGIVEAKVVSATALTDAQLTKIKDKLSKNLNKEVKVTAEVDVSLIGGMIIYVDGKELDSTVKKYLADTRQNLLTNAR